MFHVFRNSPLGRENLLQSIYFCEQVGNLELNIYLPEQRQALMYFERTSVTLDLDSSYTRFPSTALRHVTELMGATKVRYRLIKPISFTASTLPDLPARWHLMACPRVMSQHVSRIGLGYIGPRVRAIAKHAPFSVFVPSLCFKVWRRVAVFFGGSDLGVKALRQAISLAERASMPLTVYTHGDASVREACEAKIMEAGLEQTLAQPE